MNKIVNFCKECDCFVVTTNNGAYPSARPFGAMMFYRNNLYITTNKTKQVFKQILKDNHINIMAIKRNTRTWIRFNATAKVDDNTIAKKLIFKKCPRLQQIYDSPLNKKFVLLKLKINKFELHKD